MSTTSSGFFKPLLYLVLGIPLVPVLIGVVFIVYYFLHQSLMISVQAHSGGLAMIAFKRSVIEGVKVEQGQAEHVVRIINHLVLQQRGAGVMGRAA